MYTPILLIHFNRPEANWRQIANLKPIATLNGANHSLTAVHDIRYDENKIC